MSALRETASKRVAVAYSGGRDSTALLHACARMAQSLGGIEVVALHVHHGLSMHADAWVAHARAQCAGWAAQGLPVSLRWRRLQLDVAAGGGVEAVARRGRYEALAAMAREAGCDAVLLAHHRRDQAETFLLQALRGAGVAGLAAMPSGIERDGIAWLRPWLDHPRSSIAAYVAAHALSHVEDDSNGDARHARNRLRLAVWPAMSGAFDQAEGALARAAARQADVLACVHDWLADKLPRVTRAGALDVAAWRAWPAPMQRELLRAWFREVAGQGLPASWVARLQTEAMGQGARRWPVDLHRDGLALCRGELTLYRGLLNWRAMAAAHGPPVGDRGGPALPHRAWPLPITAPGDWPLPDGMGLLTVTLASAEEPGLPWSRLQAAELRPRQGGERFQMGPGRPARSLKKQFQTMGVPAWERDGPLLWADGDLLFVPGLGVNAPARAPMSDPERVVLRWRPDP